jgi:hypothetical protein
VSTPITPARLARFARRILHGVILRPLEQPDQLVHAALEVADLTFKFSEAALSFLVGHCRNPSPLMVCAREPQVERATAAGAFVSAFSDAPG